MSIPKEPRQLMINIMYLVLTALLALNVSAEILNAFKIVNKSLSDAMVAVNSKNLAIYDAFDAKVKIDPKAVAYRDKALEAKKIADDLIIDIDSMEMQLMRLVGYEINEDGIMVMTNEKNTHIPTMFMINNGNGDKLQQMVDEARTKILSLYSPEVRDQEAASMTLNAEPPPPKPSGATRTWAQYNFEEVPAIAAVTILNKLRNDVRNAESDVIDWLKDQIGIEEVSFDELKARAFAKKSFLNLGDTYEADIFVSASSSDIKPIVYIGQFSDAIKRGEDGNLPAKVSSDDVPLQPGYKKLEESEGGIVKYTERPGGQGSRTYRGVIEVLNKNTGEKTYYPFENEYTVAASTAVVSADQMNVLYIGVDNPVSISVPGFQANQIIPSITQGSLNATGSGAYNCTVTKVGDANINVSVRTDEGVKSVGSKQFRVKRIPDPKAYFANVASGALANGPAKAVTGIFAKADNFDFQVQFTIRDFEFMYAKSRSNQISIIQNQGPVFNQQIRNVLSKIKAGDRIWMDNIRIKAPDGTTRIANISIKII